MFPLIIHQRNGLIIVKSSWSHPTLVPEVFYERERVWCEATKTSRKAEGKKKTHGYL